MSINNQNLAEKTRKDFPLFSQDSLEKNKFIYLDHAATSQKPIQVIEKLDQGCQYEQ